MSESLNHSAPNLQPETPEQELMARVAARLSAALDMNERVLNDLQAQDEEGMGIKVVRFAESDSNENYIPKGDKLPALYKMLVWQPYPGFRFGIESFTTRVPVYEGGSNLVWPNDVLFAIKNVDGSEEKILLNGLGWFAYEDPSQLEPNTAEGSEDTGNSQNLLRRKEGVEVPLHHSAEEILGVLKRSEVIPKISNS